MKLLIYACILINAGSAIFLLFAAFSSDQDAAGRGMVFLPVILLIACAIGSHFLYAAGHPNWALTISGIPVIILAYLLFISVT
jgi:hypothetical protein